MFKTNQFLFAFFLCLTNQFQAMLQESAPNCTPGEQKCEIMPDSQVSVGPLSSIDQTDGRLIREQLRQPNFAEPENQTKQIKEIILNQLDKWTEIYLSFDLGQLNITKSDIERLKSSREIEEWRLYDIIINCRTIEKATQAHSYQFFQAKFADIIVGYLLSLLDFLSKEDINDDGLDRLVGSAKHFYRRIISLDIDPIVAEHRENIERIKHFNLDPNNLDMELYVKRRKHILQDRNAHKAWNDDLIREQTALVQSIQESKHPLILAAKEAANCFLL